MPQPHHTAQHQHQHTASSHLATFLFASVFLLALFPGVFVSIFWAPYNALASYLVPTPAPRKSVVCTSPNVCFCADNVVVCLYTFLTNTKESKKKPPKSVNLHEYTHIHTQRDEIRPRNCTTTTTHTNTTNPKGPRKLSHYPPAPAAATSSPTIFSRKSRKSSSTRRGCSISSSSTRRARCRSTKTSTRMCALTWARR